MKKRKYPQEVPLQIVDLEARLNGKKIRRTKRRRRIFESCLLRLRREN